MLRERVSERARLSTSLHVTRAARQRRCHEDFDNVTDVDDEQHNDADDVSHDADADDADADDAVADDDVADDDDAPAYLALPLPLQLQSVRKPEAVRRLCRFAGSAACVV